MSTDQNNSNDNHALSLSNQPLKRFRIMQWTPFPGTLDDIPHWMLQEAEYKTGIAKIYFHDCCDVRDGKFYYSATDAAAIVRYWWDWPGMRWIVRD